MSVFFKLDPIKLAEALESIGWSGGGGGDASIAYSATAPIAPSNGDLWYDTANTKLKLYSGGLWVSMSLSQAEYNSIMGVISTLSESLANADASATKAEEEATLAENAKDAILGMQVATGVAGSSVTWNGTTLTVPQGIQGIKGDAGEVTQAQLNAAISGITKSTLALGNVDNTSDADKTISTATQTALNAKANLSSNTYTAPQRTNTSASSNTIDFRIANNFTINATAANITVTSLLGCIGQGGVIVIESAENVTGWGAEFNFKTVPTSMSGMEVFSYFVQTETVIRIGRVA